MTCSRRAATRHGGPALRNTLACMRAIRGGQRAWPVPLRGAQRRPRVATTARGGPVASPPRLPAQRRRHPTAEAVSLSAAAGLRVGGGVCVGHGEIAGCSFSASFQRLTRRLLLGIHPPAISGAISRVSAETGQVTALQPVLLETYARAEGRRPSGRRAQRWTVSGYHREGEALLRGCDRRWHLRVPPNARLRQRAGAWILTQQRRAAAARARSR